MSIGIDLAHRFSPDQAPRHIHAVWRFRYLLAAPGKTVGGDGAEINARNAVRQLNAKSIEGGPIPSTVAEHASSEGTLAYGVCLCSPQCAFTDGLDSSFVDGRGRTARAACDYLICLSKASSRLEARAYRKRIAWPGSLALLRWLGKRAWARCIHRASLKYSHIGSDGIIECQKP